MNARTPAAGAELLIRKLEQYAPLTDESRQALRALPLRLQQFSRGEVIVSQDEICEESALVVSGITFRYKMLPEGSRQIVGLQVPGDFADLYGFALKPLDYAVAAAAPSTIARIPHGAIAQMLRQHPDLARWIMWDLAQDGAIAREWLAGIGGRSAYQQLAHLFCELYYRMEWSGAVSENSFELALNQSELGDACGLSTVHVNRSLQALRRDGLMILENHLLTIPDIAALAEVALFDPAYLNLPARNPQPA